MTEPSPAAELPTDWWTADQVATFLGIARGTWAAYVARNQAPAAERMFGRSPAWRPATIKTWAASRPPVPASSYIHAHRWCLLRRCCKVDRNTTPVQ
jgi:predicted DNA-binding transcriptional regulator AlpA